MKIIGLDIGERRIGVARADSETRIAVPVGTIEVDGSEWQKLIQIARTYNTNLFVLGLPRSNEGNETEQSTYVRNFAKTLMAKIPEAKIRLQDESLTSVVAEERLKKRKKNYQKGEIDTEAATIILQDFLEGLGAKVNAPTIAQGDGSQKELNSQQKIEEKDGKKKSKKWVKWLSGVIILVILGLLATGGVLWYKDMRAKERAEEYAKIEAEMKAEVFNFTILPGETIFDIQANLTEVGYSLAEVEEAFIADYDFVFLEEPRQKAIERGNKGSYLEGYLYGETHEFYETATVKEILETFLSHTGKIIEENELEAKYAERGLTLHEGVTLASVVQKEASSPEQPTVAQVFLSRLSLGIPLGSDVTVSYALDTIDPDRETYIDNESALGVNSCYNTRIYGGLPCGPISNPGLSALLAVANPSDTAYLYFLTGDDGLMYYSYTESEHIQNIYSHCQELCNVSL